jgi:hypothetical protein
VSRPLSRVTLRYSMRRAAAELALVKRRNEASAQTVLADFPRRICVSRRFSRGSSKTRSSTLRTFGRLNEAKQIFATAIQITYASVTDARTSCTPLRFAEKRRRVGGFRRGLFEASRDLCEAEFRSRPACRVSQGSPLGPDRLGRPSLGYFSWPRKRSDQPPGCPRQRATARSCAPCAQAVARKCHLCV